MSRGIVTQNRETMYRIIAYNCYRINRNCMLILDGFYTAKLVSSLKYQIIKVSSLAMASKTYLIAITLLTVSFLTAIAQTPITVTTDKPSYSDGNTISISGTVTDQLNIPISIVIKDNAQHIVYIAQTNPNPDNIYSIQAAAGGDLWKTAGTYEIDVAYGGTDKTSKTTFEFTSSPQTVSATPSQTNTTQAVPEFGPLSVSIFGIAILAVVLMYSRIKLSFKI
jgi:hypothetical protein